MKFRLAAFFVAVICSNLAVAGPFSNGDFEAGTLSPWYNVSAGSHWSVTNADAHSGTFSATDVGNYAIQQDFDGVLTDSITEVSFWLKQPEAAISYVSLIYSDATFSANVVSLVGADWEFFDITSWLVSGKFLTGFQLYGYSGGGPNEDRTYLDDVTINSTPVPAPLTLPIFGFAMLLLGLFRGRRAE